MPVDTNYKRKVLLYTARQRIGLLGGSFNPAHDGHAHVAGLALRHLRLDAVWWLVSPQNPFKTTAGMASFKDRLASAVSIAGTADQSKRMVVTDLESHLGTSRTADTVKEIRRRMPGSKFVWIMGADNLATFYRWHRSERIARTLPVAVVNRPGTRPGLLKGASASRIGHRISPRRMAANLARSRRWCFIHGPLNRQSATSIRHRQGIYQ